MSFQEHLLPGPEMPLQVESQKYTIFQVLKFSEFIPSTLLLPPEWWRAWAGLTGDTLKIKMLPSRGNDNEDNPGIYFMPPVSQAAYRWPHLLPQQWDNSFHNLIDKEISDKSKSFSRKIKQARSEKCIWSLSLNNVVQSQPDFTIWSAMQVHRKTSFPQWVNLCNLIFFLSFFFLLNLNHTK